MQYFNLIYLSSATDCKPLFTYELDSAPEEGSEDSENTAALPPSAVSCLLPLPAYQMNRDQDLSSVSNYQYTLVERSNLLLNTFKLVVS